jgi:DNA-3-methyladenine glycosylase
MKLQKSFYLRRDVTAVAKQLLGKVLMTKNDDELTGGIIVETEAYSEKEKGSHAFKGRTKRNEVMFDAGGVAYVYLCYGIHEMFNVVTNKEGKADAVLVRALEPLVGTDVMMLRMNTQSEIKIASGPGKLTKALGIDRAWNGKELDGDEIWIEDQNIKIKAADMVSSPRIGIDYAGEDALLPWRFRIRSIQDYKPTIEKIRVRRTLAT